MHARIVEFAGRLREAGVRVSTAETLNAIEGAAALGGIDDRGVFRDALRALLVKERRDIPVYDELFDRFFGSFSSLRAGDDGGALDGALSKLDQISGMEELARQIRDLADAANLEARMQALEEEVDLGKIMNRLQVSYFTRRMLDRLGFEPADPRMGSMGRNLAAQGMDEDDAAEVERELEAFRRQLREYVRSRVERRLAQNALAEEPPAQREALEERSFFSLSPREIREMNEVVARLARRLKTVLSLRRRRARRGGLDLQRSMRRNLRYGGVPVELLFRRKRLDKPEIINLCDVSGSVRHISHFMLQFLYSIQDQFARVRSFVFVRELTEVTPWFADHDIETAIRMILTSNQIDYYNNSDFGNVFEAFVDRHLGEVSHRTTVLVLGDARSNYHDPRARALETIQSRARRVVWLNPENRLTWGFGDSVMPDYAPYCDHVREVRNLKQLVRAVEDLVV